MKKTYNKSENQKKKEFIKYVYSFYGPGEIYSEFFKKTKITPEMIGFYLKYYIKYQTTNKNAAWFKYHKKKFEIVEIGYDSFDREMIRDIILYIEEGEKNIEYNIIEMIEWIKADILKDKRIEKINRVLYEKE